MLKEHRELLAAGHESHAFWGRGRDAQDETECRFATDLEVNLDGVRTRLDDRAGFHSKAATRRLLERLEQIDPDVVHLHNLHGYYLNIEILFEWLAKHRCKVEWTLHDCWAFTGHCSHSEKCPQLREYPATIGPGTCARNYVDKKRIFNLVPANRMTIITPSRWLAGLVGESFLSKYPVEVRHNTIDKTVFKPTPSDFRERYGIGDRFMILGVASPWSKCKGLDDFVELESLLDFDSYAVVLVGLDKGQRKSLPPGIIGLARTESREVLAEIYSSADVFFNPTTEDNYPTVNLEAQACGTPVLTYDTGGCKETLSMRESRLVADAQDVIACINERSALRQAYFASNQ